MNNLTYDTLSDMAYCDLCFKRFAYSHDIRDLYWVRLITDKIPQVMSEARWFISVGLFGMWFKRVVGRITRLVFVIPTLRKQQTSEV